LWFDSHKRLLTSICIELGEVDKIDELVEKYLGPQLKIKALKDPNRPKRARTAYLYYCNDKRPGIMKKMRKKKEKINVGAIQKQLGKIWGTMSDADKAPYAKLSEADKERYKEEMEVYNSEH
jgi:hypothetical protein